MGNKQTRPGDTDDGGAESSEDGAAASPHGRVWTKKPLPFEKQQAYQDKLAKAAHAHFKGPLDDDLSLILETKEEAIYLSGMKTALHGAKLNAEGITHVVNVCGADVQVGMRASGYKGELLILDIRDSEDFPIDTYFQEAFDFMRKPHEESVLFNRGQQVKILVHCQLGISRSPTVVIAYLMKFHKMNLWQATDKTAQGRGIIYPNEGFLEALVNMAHEYNKL